MGKTRNTRMMGSKAWAAVATIAVGAAVISVGCGNDGVTPVCTNVPTYANRGDAGPGGATADKIKAASSDEEKCLTPVQEGFGTSGGTAGSGAGGTGGGS